MLFAFVEAAGRVQSGVFLVPKTLDPLHAIPGNDHACRDEATDRDGHHDQLDEIAEERFDFERDGNRDPGSPGTDRLGDQMEI